MPHRLATRCCHPGCSRTALGRFCAAHLAAERPVSDQRRGTPAARGYDGDWQRVAAQRRWLDCSLCQRCLQHAPEVSAQLVDHIIPLHVRPDWRLALGNTQVLCAACHSSKTRDDTLRYGSSTARLLRPAQRQHRAEAQRLPTPPRGDPSAESD